MNKKTLRIVAVIAVLVLGGGGAFWFVNMNQTKQAVIDAIARLNAEQNQSGAKLTVTYDAVETAGFPPALTVRLVNPKMVAVIPAVPETGQQAFEMIWGFDGFGDVVTNHLGAAYGLHLKGNDTMHLKVGDKELTIEGKQSDYNFEVVAKSLDAFMAWEKLDTKNEQQMKEAFAALKELKGDVGALHYSVKGTNEPAFTQDASHARFVNRSLEKLIDFDLEVVIKNSEMHPAYGQVFDTIFTAPSPEMAMMGIQEMPFSASRAGKQNFDIAATIYVDEGEGEAPKKLNVDFQRFDVSNNYYSMTAPMRIVVEENADGTQLEMVMDTKTTYTELGANDARKMLEGLMGMATMMAGGNPAFNMEAFTAKVNEALPVVSTLGPITFAVDVKGNMKPKAEGELMQKGSIALNRFDFSHARWGLNAKGTIESAETPTVTLNVNCVKCDSFTSDLVKTGAAAQEASAMLNPAQPQYPLGDELLAALNQFLASTGKKDATSGDIAFAITTPAANDYRINEKPAATVMMEAMTTLMPFMQPQQPASAAPPIPEEALPQVPAQPAP